MGLTPTPPPENRPLSVDQLGAVFATATTETTVQLLRIITHGCVTHIFLVIGDSKVYMAASLASALMEAILRASSCNVRSSRIDGYAIMVYSPFCSFTNKTR